MDGVPNWDRRAPFMPQLAYDKDAEFAERYRVYCLREDIPNCLEEGYIEEDFDDGRWYESAMKGQMMVYENCLTRHRCTTEPTTITHFTNEESI
jgi:hypothetical protein